MQHVVGRINPYPAMTSMLEAMSHTRFVRWSFSHYLGICPPEYALPERGEPDAQSRTIR